MSRTDKNKKGTLTEASIGMTILDLFPVIFFGLSMFFIAEMFVSVWFIVGAVLCTLAGFSKVIWKFILAIKKKDVRFLYSIFKPFMITGFILIVISVIVARKSIAWSTVWKSITGFPCIIYFIIFGVSCVAMMVLGFCMDSSSKRANWIEEICNTAGQLSLCIGVAIIFYASHFYPAHELGQKALEGSDNVKVSQIECGYFFDGAGSDEAVIFYPGALVDTPAYAPLMERIASGGVDCFLVDMPYHLAIFGENKADYILENYSYESIYMMGHSLGGFMGSEYVKTHMDEFDGIVFLGAYSLSPLQKDGFKALSIVGSNDLVLNRELFEKMKKNLPSDSDFVVIEGLNHAGVADYGPQTGDGVCTLDSEKAWDMIAGYVLEMLD